MSTDASKPDSVRLGIAGRIARAFIGSKLTPLLVITSLLLGAAATLLLPREEEPQIRVPMIDVLVSMPGFSAKEVEERATRPMEKLLWEIPERGIYLLDLPRGREPGHRPLQGRRGHRAQPRSPQPEAPGQFRPHPAGRFLPAHQAALD